MTDSTLQEVKTSLALNGAFCSNLGEYIWLWRIGTQFDTFVTHVFFVLGHKNTQHPSYHMKAPHDSHCMYMYVYVFLGISLYTYHMHKLFSFDTDSVFVRFAGWDGRRLPVAAAWILLIQ